MTLLSLLSCLALTPSPQSLGEPMPVFGALRSPRGTVGADIDGDGLTDIVAASEPDGRIVWFRSEGDGHFGVAQEIVQFATEIPGIAVADFDGDGDMDVASVQEQRMRVMLHLNSGSGDFTSVTILEGPTLRPTAIEAHDLDGDGLDDLLLGFRGTVNVGWLRNLGQGAFTATLGAIASLDAIEIMGLSAGDLDGDGDAEVFATARFSEGVWAVENLGASFGAPLRLGDSSFSSGNVAVGDIDGDGDLDLGTARLGWFRNGGGPGLDLSFADRPYSATGFLGLEDLDGDGDQDFVTESSGELHWTQNDPQGAGSTGVLLATQSNGFHSFDVIDLGGGRRDLLISGPGHAVISVVPRTGSGTFAGAFGALAPVARQVTSFTAAWFDANLDGHADVALSFTEPGPMVFLGTGDGAFEESPGGPVDVNVPTTILDAGDLDGDQRADLVAVQSLGFAQRQLVVFKGIPGGFEAPTLILAPAAGSFSGEVLDVDADGDLDLLLEQPIGGGNRIIWLENDGAGQFGSPIEVPTIFSRPSVADTADINGDGRPDLLVQTLPNRAQIVLSAPSGGFEAPIQLQSDASPFLRFMDLDGDLDLDVLVIDQVFNAATARLAWHRNDGGVLDSMGSILTADFDSPVDAVLMDFDADGDRDLVLHGAPFFPSGGTGSRLVAYNLGGGAFAAPVVDRLVGTYLTRAFAEDYDGDGDEDLVTMALATGLTLFENGSSLGDLVCAGAPNSAGGGAGLMARGYREVGANSVTLSADGLPSNATTLFIVSASTGSFPAAGGSQGTLCLSGSIGRFVGPGQVQVSDALGNASLALDLTMTPTPTGAVTTSVGQTWAYQAWYRDANPGPVSNFTAAIEVAFE